MEFSIDATYNGPAGSAHGGTAAGRFAAAVDSKAATVRLHQPIPLGRPMRSMGGTHKSAFYSDGRLIATVRPLSGPLTTAQFGRLAAAEVNDAERNWLDIRDGEHMAPTCYACGHHRHDGLGLRPGPIAETGLAATSWNPGIEGEVPDWLVWAALDCPTGFPALRKVERDEAVVTGQLSVQILDHVRGDGDYQLIGRRIGGEGKKHSTEAALVDERGVAVAVASAIWFAVPLSMTRPDAVGGAIAA